MRNPLRSEDEAFRFLVVVIVGAVIIAAASWLNTWAGVVAAVVVIGAVIVWLVRAPGEPPTSPLVSATPGATHRVLLVAARGTSGVPAQVGNHATDVLVVVPALVSNLHSLTGGVDDEREEAQRTAETLAGELSGRGMAARGVVGADDTVLAIEDALREFGADEIVLAMGDDELLAKARERFAMPVTRV